MANKPQHILTTIFKIATSVSLIVAGICLIIGCIHIYRSDAENPYSREIVAQTFKYIQIPIYICLSLVLITFIGALFIPENKLKSSKPSASQLIKIYSLKRDIRNNPELAAKIKKEAHNRRIFTIILTAINAFLAVLFLIYALNPTHFDRSDINGSVISAMTILLPCLAVSFTVSLIFFFLKQNSQKREIEVWKKAPVKSAADIETENSQTIIAYSKKEKRLLITKLILIGVFLACAILGFVTGGTEDVLTKAVKICTECIGLG